MTISPTGNNPYNPNLLPDISSQSAGVGGGLANQLKQAEQVAEEGFQQTLAARRITNKYAAAKEVR